MKPKNTLFSILFGMIFLMIAACNTVNETAIVIPSRTHTVSAATQTLTLESTEPSQTPVPPVPPVPTETPFPLAARVNGEGIPLVVYESELARFRAYSGTRLATYEESEVLQDLIDQVLLAQAAYEAGFYVDEPLLEARIQGLGLSDQELQEWMTTNSYSSEDFRQALKRSIEAAWMRDQIIAAVPDTAEQVHARQILLYNSTEAEAVYAQLEAGASFETLAAEYDPVTKGSLGWFPRGYLNVKELDEIVFNLAIGAYSPVVQTPLGYHIIQLLERNSDQPLTADARRSLQAQALAQWLETKRSRSEIIILVP